MVKNKIYCGDVLELLSSLPDGSVDMVYGDPDYNVGIKYEGKSYFKSFEQYLDWYIFLSKESLRVLKDDGNMFLVNYPKQNAHLRAMFLDSACYEVLDYSWVYRTNVGFSRRHFTKAHRSVLHCMKTKGNRFYKQNVCEPYCNPCDSRVKSMLEKGSKGRMPYDWFYFDIVKAGSKEQENHPCQLPQKMLKLLMEATTLPGDTVLVLFGGSGSEVEVCKTLSRDFITAEMNSNYCGLIKSRLARTRSLL